MSMNITIRCTRQVYVPKTNMYEEQVEYLDVWQTPTKDSYSILNSKDQFGAYMEWVLANSDTVTEPVFWDYDNYIKHCFDEDSVKPDYWWSYNIGIEHLMDLYDEIEGMQEYGYNVEWIVS